MDDINLLNPLQTLVPVCGQVRFYDSDSASEARPYWLDFWRTSVGAVLLAVHYGKYWTSGLDNLSDHRVRPDPFGLSSTAPLDPTFVRVAEERRSPLGRSTDAAHHLGRVGSRLLEGWIDTEVEFT